MLFASSVPAIWKPRTLAYSPSPSSMILCLGKGFLDDRFEEECATADQDDIVDVAAVSDVTLHFRDRLLCDLAGGQGVVRDVVFLSEDLRSLPVPEGHI